MSLCAGTGVQSEPCHMRGLAMYKRLSRENPHWISLSSRQNMQITPCVFCAEAKSIVGFASSFCLGCIGQLAVGLPGGAQHEHSSLMIVPCLRGQGAEQIRTWASEADWLLRRSCVSQRHACCAHICLQLCYMHTLTQRTEAGFNQQHRWPGGGRSVTSSAHIPISRWYM